MLIINARMKVSNKSRVILLLYNNYTTQEKRNISIHSAQAMQETMIITGQASKV